MPAKNPKVVEKNNDEFEEDTPIPLGRKKVIKVQFAAAAAGNRTGVLIRHFARVDGIPVANVIHANDYGTAATVTDEVSLKAVRGTTQSVRAIVWDRVPAAGGTGTPSSVADITARRVRFQARNAQAD